MNPRLRKLALTAHITLSVGWLGAVAAYLALAIVGLTSHDVQMASAAYLSMEVIGRFVIIPFSLAALLTGLVEALGTPWGLFKHWWVSTKFLLTAGATVVLLQHIDAVEEMSGLARQMTSTVTDFRALRIQLVVHAAGGLLVLFGVTVLSVYKPWGMTPYGLRTEPQRRRLPTTGLPSRPSSNVDAVLGSATKTPRWASVIGVHAVGLVFLLVVLHLFGGGRIH